MRKAGVQMATVRLTEGNVWGTIVRFAVPFLLANLFQALYGAADLFMVGPIFRLCRCIGGGHRRTGVRPSPGLPWALPPAARC